MSGVFTIKGNIYGERIQLDRAMQKPPLNQQQLVNKVQLLGGGIAKIIISRIENGDRHVCDAELHIMAMALDVSMDWLVGDTDNLQRNDVIQNSD